jgi:hypothetical protein
VIADAESLVVTIVAETYIAPKMDNIGLAALFAHDMVAEVNHLKQSSVVPCLPCINASGDPEE